MKERFTILNGYCFLIWISFVTILQGQVNYDWRSSGPENLWGIITDLEYSPNGTLYCGILGGGLWKSLDDGLTWAPVEGFNANNSPFVNRNLFVSDILIDPNDPNRIYVATGNLYGSRTLAYNQVNQINSTQWGTFPDLNPAVVYSHTGQGVFVSTDGGNTFSNVNATWSINWAGGDFPQTNFDLSNPWVSVHKLAISGTRIFAGTHKGVYYTDDGFQTVQQPSKGSYAGALANEIITDIAVIDSGKILFGTYNYIYVATQNGDSVYDRWTKIPGLNEEFTNFFGRVRFAVAPSNPHIVYITGINNDFTGNEGYIKGVWRSTDNGNTWERIAPGSSALFQPFNGLGLNSILFAVDPVDPLKVYLGGDQFMIYTETDGWKKDWRSIPSYPGDPKYVGGGLNAIAINPTNPNIFVVGSNFHLFRTTDGGASFASIKNVSTARILQVHRSVDDKTYASSPFEGDLAKPNPSSNVFANYNLIPAPYNSSFATSVRDGNILLRGRRYGCIQLSFDGGQSFTFFYGTPDSASPNKADTLVAGDFLPGYVPGSSDPKWGQCTHLRVPIFGPTPFVLDEYKQDSVVIVDSTGQVLYPAYLYTFLKNREQNFHWGIWVATNPTGVGGLDSLLTSKWTRVSDPISLLKSQNSGIFLKNEFPSALTVSPDNLHTVYAGTSTGKFYRVLNANDVVNYQFTRLDTISGANLPAKIITDIAVNPSDPTIVALSYGSYDTTGGYLYLVFNATSPTPTFVRVQNPGLPLMPIYSLAFNPQNPNMLILGTEYGLWLLTDIQNYNTAAIKELNTPPLYRTPIYDIYIKEWSLVKEVLSQPGVEPEIAQYRLVKDPNPVILLATAGQGVMETQLYEITGIEPLFTSSESLPIKAFPNPTHANLTVKIQKPMFHSSSYSVTIYNVHGQKVLDTSVTLNNSSFFTISVESLPKGFYILECTEQKSNSKGQIKFIKY